MILGSIISSWSAPHGKNNSLKQTKEFGQQIEKVEKDFTNLSINFNIANFHLPGHKPKLLSYFGHEFKLLASLNASKTSS